MIANSPHRTVLLTLCGLLIFVSLAWANPYATSKVFTVTSAGSSRNEVGTLNWAVFQADYSGADVNFIVFNIPNLTPQTEIVLSEPLYIARLMVLSATTQPNYAGQPLIRIDANNLDSAFIIGTASNIPPYSDGSPATGGGNPGIPGVRVASAGSTIEGFRIFNFRTNAVTILKEAEGNFVQNNWIGFKPAGQLGVFLRNSDTHANSSGLGIQSNFNSIRFNTISGVSNGVDIGEDPAGVWSGRSYVTNAFEHNYIGTDPTGSFKIGNDSDGIFLGAGAQQNFIGPGNVLSGMSSSGVELLAPSVSGNIVIGNLIGLNAAGDAAIPNGELGVLVANGAYFNDVGSPDPKYGNVISGNTLGGVVIGQPGYLPIDHAWGTWVENNLIGTDKTGTRVIGSQITGVTLQNGTRLVTVRFNVLAGHINHGALISSSTNNGLFGNWIGRNQSGSSLPNQGYGVFLVNASYNYVGIGMSAPNPPYFVANFIGTNILGPVGLSGTCVGNVIDPH